MIKNVKLLQKLYFVDVIERYESIVGEGDRKKYTIRSVGSKDAERPSKNYQDNLQELRDRIEKMESEKKIRTLEGIIIRGDVTFVTPQTIL